MRPTDPSRNPGTESGLDSPSHDSVSDELPDDPEETIRLWLRPSLEDAPFWKEVEAFNEMPQIAIDEYYGQYVAVYQGNIVDADPDEGELALRFYRTFGYVPVYIHKVGTEEGLIDTQDR